MSIDGPESRPSLSAGASLVLGRDDSHGPALANVEATAKLWSALFGIEITPADYCLAMILVKVQRESSRPNPDNADDIEGYVTILRMVRNKGDSN